MSLTDQHTIVPDDLSSLDSPPFRPASPDHGPGRRLRAIVGVSEDILDWVPEERPRYARLGAIVVNTASLAALSLGVALGRTLGVPWPILIPVGMFWGYVILSFDGWLVTSTHGLVGRTRLTVFAGRILISVLMGMVIAEPMVLWVFSSDIRQEVLNGRSRDLEAYGSALDRCNPASGELVWTPECADLRIADLHGSPASLRTEKAAKIRERDNLRRTIEERRGILAGKETFAQQECSGVPSPTDHTRSGIPGNGKRCQQAWNLRDQYFTSSRIGEDENTLGRLNEEINKADGSIQEAESTYRTALADAIHAKLDKKQKHYGRIGFLEETAALARLADQSHAVLTGEWLLRILLVLVDCLPALTKLMSGRSRYDDLVSRQSAEGQRLHERYLARRSRQALAADDVELQQIEHDFRIASERINEADRAARADRETELDLEIENLAARFRHADSTAA
ncbi:DUF4407 domain-containing protein [Parafrankia sp. EUN1f]|uniref:DUF4407 domain-containing protein n=1 Tax=Parafrankia sp. EUN1f TaxID=102897 RepID=UPI0001C474C7|nr:DUF4407 domain-containing protein [Parafrankia sp. EUN1f]EFC79781.1 hypothetical protein FrEUN1fDRAFT_7110 [Parafrankia sp. EUN1f]